MKRRKGFSFVEILFAVFLLTACATIVVSTMPVANVSRERANLNALATGLAQKQLETVRGMGYANASPSALFTAGLIESTTPVAANEYSFSSIDVGNNDSPASRLPNGGGRVRIEQLGIDLRRVTVIVNYTYQNRVRTVTIGTLIANL
jgi:type II secretory pathway pseudopilin PulG